MVDQDSAELKVLRSAYSHLVNSISVSSILPEARATELITIRDYDDCKAESTVCKQAEKLMQCVERAVVADPEKFNSFLSILDQCEQKGIANYLRGTNRSMMLAKIQLHRGARVYLPDELKVVHKLTCLETAYCKLLTDFEETVREVLVRCSSTQHKVFISTLQNILERDDFVDFQSGFKFLKKDVSLFNITYLRNTVEILPENERIKPNQLLTAYEMKLQDFMKGTAVDDYKKYCEEHLLELISSSIEPVSMKLSDIWRRRTLDDLKLLTCRLLKVPGSRLHLHTITEDCIAVHWLCPVNVLPALRMEIRSATDSLQLEGIQQIFIGKESVMHLTSTSSLDSFRSIMQGQMANIISYTSQLPMAMDMAGTAAAAAPIAAAGISGDLSRTLSSHERDLLNTPPEMSDLIVKVAHELERRGWGALDYRYPYSLETIAFLLGINRSIFPLRTRPRYNHENYIEVFLMWQRGAGSRPYTWATIIDVLRSPIVEEHQLANELQEWVINRYS